MIQGGAAGSPGAGRKRWLLSAVIGLTAVIAGIVLPQAFMGNDAGLAGAAKGAPAAADSLEYNPPPLPGAPGAGAMLARLMVGTLVVLGLCVGTLWFGKRWVKTEPPRGANSRLAVVESLALGNRCSVILVRAGPRQVLAGVDGTGLKALVALPDLFEDALEQAQTEEPTLAASLASLFAQAEQKAA
jgi:flagellar biogenesis protein FliO